MKLNKPIFLSSFLIIFLLNSMLVTSQEVENEKEFNYIEGSDKGPDHWGQIHKDWAACGNGHMQSPIDLLNEKVEVVHHLERLKRRYKPSNASLVNRGHDIMLKWEYGAGSLFVNGMEYVLRQCHWHSPSEHTIDGQRYNLEVHMVHESLDKKMAVVGIMYKVGRRDKFLTELMDYVRAISNSKDAEKVVGLVNPKRIKVGSRKYYRYMGSLTTPPCTEGVTWTIIKKVRTVSREQVRLFREAVRDDSAMNARPTQDTNNRTVHLYSSRRIHT